jgi:hypothetical protein
MRRCSAFPGLLTAATARRIWGIPARLQIASNAEACLGRPVSGRDELGRSIARGATVSPSYGWLDCADRGCNWTGKKRRSTLADSRREKRSRDQSVAAPTCDRSSDALLATIAHGWSQQHKGRRSMALTEQHPSPPGVEVGGCL